MGRRLKAVLILGCVLVGIAACEPAPVLTSLSDESSPVVTVPDVLPGGDILRDCGFETPLGDGQTLWIFCDTTVVRPTVPAGMLVACNTAAVAPEGGFPVDHLEVGVQPVPSDPCRNYDPSIWEPAVGGLVQFIDPPATDPCPAAVAEAGETYAGRRIWPLAAATVEGFTPGVARVWVYFEHVCLFPGATDVDATISGGIGVAAYDHVMGTTPTGPIEATVVQPVLWDGALPRVEYPASSPAPLADKAGGFGRSAVYNGGDGHVYVYRCFWQWADAQHPDPPETGCQVGRVPGDQAGSAAAYRWGNPTTGWSASPPTTDPATYMDIPGAPDVGVVADVHWYPDMDKWGLTYIPWPGLGDELALRIADTPWGRWSAAAVQTVPGSTCADAGAAHRTACRAGYGHPSLSGPASTAFSFYNEPDDQPLPPTSDPDGHRIQLSAVTAIPYSFVDVPPSHPFYDDIEWLAAEGIAEGYADHTFRPTDAMSRQAVAAWLYRAAGSPAYTPPGTATFSDVPVGSTFFTEIEWMVARGIGEGYGDGTFRPTDPATRQAMAAWLMRSEVHGFDASNSATFRDVPTSHTFYDEIEWMAFTGLSEGYPEGTGGCPGDGDGNPDEVCFDPTADVTRQAAAAFFARAGQAPTIGGTVTRSTTGAAVAGHVLQVRLPDKSSRILARTRSNGTYDAGPLLADRDYLVRFASGGDGFHQQWWNNRPTQSTADLVEVAGASVTGVNAVLTPSNVVPVHPAGTTFAGPTVNITSPSTMPRPVVYPGPHECIEIWVWASVGEAIPNGQWAFYANVLNLTTGDDGRWLHGNEGPPNEMKGPYRHEYEPDPVGSPLELWVSGYVGTEIYSYGFAVAACSP